MASSTGGQHQPSSFLKALWHAKTRPRCKESGVESCGENLSRSVRFEGARYQR